MLEVSEVPHWAQTFQVLAKMNIQQEAKSTQVTAPNFSVPPLQVNVQLSHQQAGINRLTQVVPKVHTSIIHLQHPTIKIGLTQVQVEADQSEIAALLNCHQFPTIECPEVSTNLSNRGMALTSGFNITTAKGQTKGAKIFVQPLAHAALGCIQELNEKDTSATIPWLDQVKLVVEKTGNNPVEVGISKSRGLALGDINTIRKEEGLTWHKFRQILI